MHLLSTSVLLKSDLESARREALAACIALEQTSSVLASLPHFMALGLNTMTSKGIDASISALAETCVSICGLTDCRTTLMLTGVEELVLFVINMYKSCPETKSFAN